MKILITPLIITSVVIMLFATVTLWSTEINVMQNEPEFGEVSRLNLVEEVLFKKTHADDLNKIKAKSYFTQIFQSQA